jgi:hypothetical protein
MIEGSLDGLTWTEIDWRTKVDYQRYDWIASFPATKSMECRFIRITQTGLNSAQDNSLLLRAFEIFGTLLEFDP